MYIEEITMEELEKNIKKNPVVIIPLGSVEEHGKHLPLSTDTIQIIEILKIVEKETNVFIAPPIHYGVCRSTEDHVGTIGISPSTMRALIKDLLKGYYRQGFKYIFLISGHAGKLHLFSIIEACEEFIKTHDNIRIFVYSELELIKPALKNIIETDYDSHAGEIETSRILYINKNLVKKNYKTIQADEPRFFKGEIVKNKTVYWKSGIWGEPSKASPEKGSTTILLSAKKIIETIKSVMN